MSRSLKNLYPSQYEDYKNSSLYKVISKTQVEAQEAKEECKKLAEHRCQICGEYGLDAHHIVPITEDNVNNEQTNLICLCRKCHQQVHKGVYIIDPETRQIRPGELQNIPEDRKPVYIKQYEELYNQPVYASTNGYYTFVRGVKRKLVVSEIKAAVGYTPQDRSMSPEKRRSIADRKILKDWAKVFKSHGNNNMWHKLNVLITKWDTIEAEEREATMKQIYEDYIKENENDRT